MVQRLCTSGNHEMLKSGVHGAAGFIAGVMAAYNIAACCFRGDPHLRLNAVLYTLFVAWEIKQTLHHLQTPARQRRWRWRGRSRPYSARKVDLVRGVHAPHAWSVRVPGPN